MMLDRYNDILDRRKIPYYLEAKSKNIDVDFENKSLKELWELHDEILKEEIPPISLKREIADRILENCVLCERRCGVNRKKVLRDIVRF